MGVVMSDITIKNPAMFCEFFLEHYLANGLGTMQKRDIDILVFYLLLQDNQYNLPEDIFIASRKLKLTEAKTRNLYQEVQLRYQQYNKETAKHKFLDLLKTQSFERKGNKITFIVRDPMLRQYFEEWVANEKGFTDTSFNKNLAVIHKETLLKIIQSLSSTSFKTIRGKFPKELAVLNGAQDEKGLFKMFIDEFMKSAGKEAGSLSITSIVTGLKMLFFA
jgi:hypothetical protein